MPSKIKFFIGLIVLGSLSLLSNVKAQSNVDVSSLSDQQIQTLIQNANSKGISMDQAIQIAKAQGATQTQIDQLKQRMEGSSLDKTKNQSTSKTKKSEYTDEYEEDYSKKKDIQINEKLKRIFGHQLFNSENLSFEPSVNISIPKDYVLGVNDELTISVSGASQQTYQLTIDRNGNIYIPNIGPVYLMGVEFDDARRTIKKRLTSVFWGMVGSNPNTWADVSISSLRSIKVNVVGEAMIPGTYSLPATASAFNALYLSGGPNENGSFRNIRVVRDNKVIKIVDVYDYLLNSDAKSNISLRDQDVIYIPTYENRVDAEGAFKRVGLYELKKGENMANLLNYVGGFTGEAFKSQVSVVRFTDSQKKIIDVKAKDFASFLPENGDSITSGVVLDRYENRVSISGAVFRPGTYSMSEGMKLSELIAKAQGLREDVFNNRGLIFRLDENLVPTSKAFSVSDIRDGKTDVELQREDSVVIQDISSMREKRFVRIFGEVQKPGEFEYNENMTIRDLIFLSGGLNEAASESYIEISRRHDYNAAAKLNNNLVELFQLKINRGLELADTDKRFELHPFDYIYVRKAPSYFEQKTVTIEGEVLYPGPYSIRSKNERVSDLVKRCGGLTPHAYIKGATLFRAPNKEDQDTTVISAMAESDTTVAKAAKHLTNGRVELQLDKIMKDTTCIYNYHLKDGDRIVIPEVSEEVRVAGEILNPVGLAYEPRRTAKYYIDRSGGFSEKANTRRVYVIYSDGTTRVTRSFIFTSYPRVQPGCKIIVPEKETKQRIEPSMWLAIASTFSSIAVAIAAVLP
jgi:protein involved in polysaccharide export with SLBB domain